MPDVTVTVGAQDDGSLGAAISTAKAKLDELKREMASGPGKTSAMADLAAHKAEQDAFWAAERIRKGTTYIPVKPMDIGGGPPPGGLGGPPLLDARKKLEEQNKKTSQSEEQLEETTEHTASSFERMAGRIVTRMVVFEALRLAFDGIKNTIEAASQKQFDVVQFKNVADTVKDINTELGNTQKIAEATAQSFDQVYQARLKMHEAGVGFEQQGAAVQIAGELGRIWGEDAGQLSEMEAHIATGTASEAEMYHIATLLGGEYRKQADAYRDMVTQAPLIERSMERQKVLADRQLEDQQRIGNIRQAFYEQHGIAEQVFRDKYRQVDPTYWNKEEAIAHATYGAREGLQKKFAQGQAQMQKDLGVSDTTMTELINSGVIGSKQLLDASREAEQQRKRNADRGFADQKSAIDLGKDDSKLKLMHGERDALFDQVKSQTTLHDLAGKYNAEQQTLVGQTQKVGTQIKRAQEDSGKTAENVAKGVVDWLSPLVKAIPIADRFKGLQPWEIPHPASLPGQPGSVERLAARMGAQPEGEPPVSVLNKILEVLKLVFTGA